MGTTTIKPSEVLDATKPDRRDTLRTRVPSIEIQCDGNMYIVKDWSFGGCQIDNFSGELRPGNTISLELYLLGFHDCDCLPIEAEVIRFEPDNNNALTVKFLDLNAQAIMSYCDNVEKNLGI